MTKQFERRQFIKSSAAMAAAFSIIPRHVLGGEGFLAPSDTLTKAVIGVGGMGMGHLGYQGAKLMAVADVDEAHLAAAMAKGKEINKGEAVQGYKDFREVLERKDIDIVHIPTPPHWHALIAIAAANAGKDIWCEKPMSRTIAEGQKIVEAVKRNGSIFRLNTWFRFSGNMYGFGTPCKPIKKVVESGMLGWPLKVTIGKHTGFNWKLNMWFGKTNLAQQTVPQQLDYDMWLGPAPYKPYNAHRVHQTFRGYWDYDGGGLGDMGQHYLDPVQYILGKDNTSPVYIEAETASQHHDAVTPWRRIVMRYADGCEIILDGDNRDTNVPFIEGPDGKLFPGLKSDIPNLVEKLKVFKDPAEQITDFSHAVRTRQKFALNENNGLRSCTLINLGKIAIKLGRSLHFDPVTMRFINDAQANRLVDQPMRGQWQL